jgi:hypothetical protein
MDYESREDMFEYQDMEDSMLSVDNQVQAEEDLDAAINLLEKENAIYAHDERGHRVDTHRPSAINPGDYEYVKVDEARKARVDGQTKLAGPAGTCHHCGKAIVWRVFFKHIPTGNLVTFGYQCADILKMTDNRIDHEMNLLKRQAANERQQEEWNKTVEDRRADWETNHPDEAAFVRDYKGEFGQDFINRIRWGIDKYGSPLDNQIESIKKFIAGRQAFEDRKLEEAKQLEDAPLLADGRQTIEGIIVSEKYTETVYGRQHKMLVKMDDGNKVFGTMPDSIEHAVYDTERETAVGMRIKFDAKVEPKEDHFGFYSRPTKAQVV